ncbi:MAG: HAMP domain-containing sensor histidine kinase [Lacunisphaera sp.]|nr:HAMP domain-containing sensor histidine kinase [Lacunisphaera sp.]
MGTSHPGLALKNRTILIVANDRAKVRSLTDILRPEGYLVTTLDAAAAGDFPETAADLILLDVELPGVPAFEICRRLKDRGGAAATVIFIASQSDPQEVVEGLAAGGVDYLPSPFRRQEVLARIRVHLLNRLRLAQLNKDDKAKNRLLCMAAHDLRNPLVSIRALANIMRAGSVGTVTSEQHDLLDTVYDASQSMLDLVNELLDVSVLEAGELKLTPHPTSLTELIAASVRLSNAIAAEKGSLIAVEPGPLPPELSIDGPKIRQVLNNLLGNAIKFSPPGSTITVATFLTPGHCAIAVRDQGPGIPESESARLFKDFSRTSVKPTGGESTTGLGLSICYTIMQAHAGTIGARSLPGGGAEFRITFPVNP